MNEITPHGSEQRKVSIPLIAGIVVMPYIFAWFTLKKGYSVLARGLSLGWLAACVSIIAFAPEAPKKTEAPKSEPTQEVATAEIAQPAASSTFNARSTIASAVPAPQPSLDEIFSCSATYLSSAIIMKNYGGDPSLVDNGNKLAKAWASAGFSYGAKLGVSDSALDAIKAKKFAEQSAYLRDNRHLSVKALFEPIRLRVRQCSGMMRINPEFQSILSREMDALGLIDG